MSKFVSGVTPSPYDSRDFVYSSVKEVKTSILPQKFLKPEWEVNFQDRYGSCVGQAASGVKDCHETKESGILVRTSPLFIYSKCKELDGLKQPGTYPRIAMQVLKEDGICLEDEFPYHLLTDDINPIKPSIDIIKKANKYKIKSYARVNTIEEIKSAIMNDGPVLTAFVWFDNMNDPEFGGFLPMPNGYLLGGHALMISGWDNSLTHTYKTAYMENKTFKGFFRVRNSWGDSWGDKGYCWVPYQFFKDKLDVGMPYVMENWTSVDIVVNPPNPKPEPPKPQPKDNRVRKIFDVAPLVKNSRTMLELRNLSNITGVINIEWNQNEQKATLFYPNKKVEIWINKKDYHVTASGIKTTKTFDIAPIAINGRTMLELRGLSNVTEATNIEWNQNEQKVTLFYPGRKIEMWLGNKEYIETKF